MISLAEARTLIAKNISSLPAVVSPLDRACGRVLRQEVAAKEDVPGFDRSAMDGYAIASADTSEKFRIVAEIQPGAPPKCKIGRGECARIFTGAPIPAGASQVLMQEDVHVEGGFMIPVERSRVMHVRHRGEDARKGDLLLKSGTRLGAGEVALLASLGVTRLKIAPAVRVAHFATGDELVALDQKLKPGQIRDSNSTLVAALVRQFGGEIVKQGRVADDFDLLLKKTRALKKSFDLLLLSGGASVGDYDFGKKLLTALGFKIHFTAINLRPGKPLVFATRGKQAAFVVPGNPVSHLVTLHAAVRLAFEQFAGAKASWPLARVKLAESFDFKPGARETFWPARMEVNHGELVVQALRWQSSGDVTGLIGVNALLQLGANTEAPKAGEEVSVLMLDVP
jgi:molybdopterin molybdotransferase